MMIKSERTFTTTYTGGAPNGIAILRTDGSLLVQPDRGMKFVIEGVARAVLEENAAYLAWREEQGGTPGTPTVTSPEKCTKCGGSGRCYLGPYLGIDVCDVCNGSGTSGADPTASWPLCAVCGKSAREGRHATDLGDGHDYVPGTPPEGAPV